MMIWSSSPDSKNGGRAGRARSTDSPNGRQIRTAVTMPATRSSGSGSATGPRSQDRNRPAAVGSPGRRSCHRRPCRGRPERAPDGHHRDERDEDPELRLDDRGDDREDRRPLRAGRATASRSPSSRKTTPNESTWPQTTLSNQLTGLTTATKAAAEREPVAARRARGPSTRPASRWRGRPGSAAP